MAWQFYLGKGPTHRSNWVVLPFGLAGQVGKAAAGLVPAMEQKMAAMEHVILVPAGATTGPSGALLVANFFPNSALDLSTGCR
jgi:hypothetical protein